MNQIIGGVLAVVIALGLFSWLQKTSSGTFRQIKSVITAPFGTPASSNTHGQTQETVTYITGRDERGETEEASVISVTPEYRSGRIAAVSSDDSMNSAEYAPALTYKGLTIAAVSVGQYGGVLVKNNRERVYINKFKIRSKTGETVLSLPGGIIESGQSFVVYEGTPGRYAMGLFGRTSLCVWSGNKFLSEHDTIFLLDERENIITSYSY